MKLHLPLLLLGALLASLAPAATYLAEGVNPDDLVHSERFYDTGKGYYWDWEWDQPYMGAKALYQKTGNYDFFGMLTPRIKAQKTFSASVFDNLTDDANTCGYQVPENVLQYWLSYYGVFYKGTKELPYGYAYDREYLDDLGGTQSLAMSMLFYDTWKNQGNNLDATAEWFLTGDYDSYYASWMRPGATEKGGYFADYFTESSTRYRSDVGTLRSLKSALVQALGMQEDAAGRMTQQTVGNIAYLGLDEEDGYAGHAITCYGIETAADGTLLAMYCTNSDDSKYTLFPLYVREYKGRVYLYTDAACTELWDYAGGMWYVSDVSYIRTPEVLQQMYAEYHDAATPLVWNGSGTKGWTGNYTRATTDALPDSSTGWDVSITGGAFHSYYEEGRPVQFDDSAASGMVSVSGTLQVPEMILANNTLAYTFTGSGATVQAPVRVSGAGSASWSGVTLRTQNLSYSRYNLRFGQNARLEAAAGTLGNRAVLGLDGGSAQFSSTLTLGSGSILSVTSASSLQASSLVLQGGSTLDFTLSPAQTSTSLLTYTGSLSLSGTVDVLIGGSGLVSGTRYRLMSLSSPGANLTQSLFCNGGTLSLSGNVLYLTYAPTVPAVWDKSGATWSATSWSGNSLSTQHAALTFDTAGAGTVLVVGKVMPDSVEVRGGAYTFQAGSDAAISVTRQLVVRESASLTTSVPLTAKNIELRDKATLSYALSGSTDIASLDTAAGTTLTFGGNGAYTLRDSHALAGNLIVSGTSALTLSLDYNLTIDGTVRTDAGSSLTFAGHAADAPSVYTLSKGLGNIAGSITVGSGGLLRTEGNLSKAITIESNGVLELGGSGTCNAALNGNGTLRVAKDADFIFTVDSKGKPTYATTLALDVAGQLTIGNSSSVTKSAVARDLSVSGDMDVYTGSGTFDYNSITLDGGCYRILKPFIQGDWQSIVQNVNVVTVEEAGGTIATQHERRAYVGQSYSMFINRLGGCGDLTIEGNHFMGVDYYKIDSLSAEGYTGNILMHNTFVYCTHRTQLSLELGACTLEGWVKLQTDDTLDICRTSLGITGDVTLGGLDGGIRDFLYSGSLRTPSFDVDSVTPQNQITAEKHTLTIDGSGTHEFGGQLLTTLDLVKKGTGSQSFTGDMAAFAGSIKLQGGTLGFGSAVSASGIDMAKGTELRSTAALTTPSLNMKGATLSATQLTGTQLSLSGCNRMTVNSLTSSGTCAMSLGRENLETPILSLNSSGTSASLTLNGLSVSYAAADTYKATYKLLEYSSAFGGKRTDLKLTSNGRTLTIGNDASAEAYYLTSTVGGKTLYTLMLHVLDGEMLLPRTTPTTLTWRGGSAVWAQEKGYRENTWSGSVDNTNYYDGDTVIFSAGGATVTLAEALSPAVCTVNHASGTLTFAGSGSLAGQARLNKSGAGTLSITTANTYSGGTTLSAGTLSLGNAAALGTGTVNVSGGTLRMGSYAVTNAITATGGSLSGTAYAGTLTVRGDVSLSSAFKAKQVTLVTGTLSGGSLSNTAVKAQGGTLSSPLTGTSSLTSSGSVTVTGSNTHTGGTTITGGTLSLGSAAALGKGGVALSGGTLAMGAHAVTNAITATGGTLSGTAYAGALTVEGGVSLSGAVTAESLSMLSGTLSGGSLSASAVTLAGGTLASVLTGNGALTVSGTAALSGNNTYTGGTTVTGGTLALGSATALGKGAVTLSGGTLAMGAYAVTNAITATGGSLSGTAYAGALTVNGEVSVGDSFRAGSILLNGGSLSGGSIADSRVTVRGGRLSARLTGSTSLTSSGNLSLGGANSHTGGTTISGGTLTLAGASALGRGGVSLSAGTLDMGDYAVFNPIEATGGTLRGTAYAGTLTVRGAVNLGLGFCADSIEVKSGVLQNGSIFNADVYLCGGELTSSLLGGRLIVQSDAALSSPVHVSELSLQAGALQADIATADVEHLLVGGGTLDGDLTCNGGSITIGKAPLVVSGTLDLLSDTEWGTSTLLTVGNTYTLAQAERILGDVSQMVFTDTRQKHLQYDFSVEGNRLLVSVTKAPADLEWAGGKGLWYEGATIGGDCFFARDRVHVYQPSAITIRGDFCPGLLAVECTGNVTLTADRKTPGSGISGKGSVVKSRIGTLTMNAGNTYTGGTVLNAGTIKATAADSFGTGLITINGGTLDLGSKAVGNDIVLRGSATLKGDGKYTGEVTVDGDAMLLAKTSYKGWTTIGEGCSLTLAAKATMAGSISLDGGALIISAPKGMTLAKNATMQLNGGSVTGLLTLGAGSTLVWQDGSFAAAPALKGGTLDLGGETTLTLSGSKAQVQFGDRVIDLPGKGLVKTNEALTVNSGTVTVNAMDGYEGEITVNGGTLKLATGKQMTDNTLIVQGAAAVVNGKTHSGNITVNGTLAKGTNITIAADKTVSLHQEGTLLGTIGGAGIVDINASINATAAKLTAATINLNSGTFTNTKGMKLAKGQTLTLAGAALELGPKGTLSTVAGSTLVVSAPTAITGSLTLGGGELVFEGGSLKMSGTLTLSKPMTVTGSGCITYTTLKAAKNVDVKQLLGEETVWDEENHTLSFNGGVPAARMAAAPLDAAAEEAPAPLDAAPAAPVANPVADAMVQADWGILDAERAFMGAVADRSQHATLLDKGKGAAWVSAFGASVRHGNRGVHHGSDGNIEGAAFGLEHAVSDTGTLGLAVGRSKNRIAATGVTHLRQETAHVALYGQKQLKHGFTADAAATYGDTETKLGAAAWQQKSAVLSARLTHARMLTDATAFRTFGGLTYEATESGSILGTAHTGSVQNFRGELGAGITHTAGKAHLYAEAALTGDMVRHNPTVDLGGFRTHGANPGRLGVRATVGGIYEFSDTWSGTASYGIEAESRSTAHTLNIGVSKSF